MVYQLLLAGHSLNRWLVLGLLLIATVRGTRGWITARPWLSGDDRTGRLLTTAVDLQLLLGLVLHVGFQPLHEGRLG